MPRPPVDAKLARYKHRLGKIPDQDIAELAGVSRTAVVNYRKREGIEAYDGYKFLPSIAQAPATKPAAKGAKAAATGAKAAKAAPIQAKSVAQARPPPAVARRPAPTQTVPVAPAPRAPVAKRVESLVSAAAAQPAAKLAAPLSQPTPTIAVPAVSQAIAPGAPLAATRVAFSVAVDLGTESRTYVVLAGDIVGAARAAVDLVAARHKGATVRAVQKVAEVL